MAHASVSQAPQRSRAATGFRAIQKNAIIFRFIRWEKRCEKRSTPMNRWDAGTKARGLMVRNFAEICASRRSAIPRFDGTDLMHWSGWGK